MAKIYVVRHGQTDWNIQNRFQGTSDIPLNDTGRKQAVTTGGQLKNTRFDAVYCSPLSRAKETCDAILTHNVNTFSGEVVYDDRIRERDFGDWEGKLVSDIIKDRSSNNWWNFKNEKVIPNGESLSAIETRVQNFLKDIKSKHKDEKILIVAHGGVARVIYYTFNPKPEDGDMWKFYADNASIAEYVLDFSSAWPVKL